MNLFPMRTQNSVHKRRINPPNSIKTPEIDIIEMRINCEFISIHNKINKLQSRLDAHFYILMSLASIIEHIE